MLSQLLTFLIHFVSLTFHRRALTTIHIHVTTVFFVIEVLISDHLFVIVFIF